MADVDGKGVIDYEAFATLLTAHRSWFNIKIIHIKAWTHYGSMSLLLLLWWATCVLEKQNQLIFQLHFGDVNCELVSQSSNAVSAVGEWTLHSCSCTVLSIGLISLPTKWSSWQGRVCSVVFHWKYFGLHCLAAQCLSVLFARIHEPCFCGFASCWDTISDSPPPISPLWQTSPNSATSHKSLSLQPQQTPHHLFAWPHYILHIGWKYEDGWMITGLCEPMAQLMVINKNQVGTFEPLKLIDGVSVESLWRNKAEKANLGFSIPTADARESPVRSQCPLYSD